jgi:TPR repeat protein
MYWHGRGGPQDYAQAALWLHKAADQGDAATQSMRGNMYAKDHGVPKDYAQESRYDKYRDEDFSRFEQAGALIGRDAQHEPTVRTEKT